MTNIDSLTLAQLETMALIDSRLRGYLNRAMASTYEDFIALLYIDIDSAIIQIEGDAHLVNADSEDRISVDIVHQLRQLGYEANHGQEHKGRTDIFVQGHRPAFKWIGEAKIHSSYDYLMEGFLQLCTRYTTGTEQGGVLIYIKGQNGKEVMENWLTRLREKSFQNFRDEACAAKQSAFYSTHIHQDSGLPFRVRHIPVFLSFSPKDKSARIRSE